MLALLVCNYSNGVFSSQRIERATWRNKAAFEAAFLEVFLLARATGLLKLGTMSIKPAPAQAGGYQD
jgi:hypothetical protein